MFIVTENIVDSEETKVKRMNKALSVILASMMLTSGMTFAANAAGASYELNFVYDIEEECAYANVYVSGGAYNVGRFSFDYDETNLELAETASVPAAVVGFSCDDYVIGTTAETAAVTDALNTAEGKIFFAWYADADNSVDASSEKKQIATVKFNFKADGSIATAEYPANEFKKAATVIGAALKNAELEGWTAPAVVADPKNVISSASTTVTKSVSLDISDKKNLDVESEAGQTTEEISFDTPEDDDAIEGYEFTIFDQKKNPVGRGRINKPVPGTTQNVELLDEDGEPSGIEAEVSVDKNGRVTVAVKGLKPDTYYNNRVDPIGKTGQTGLGFEIPVMTEAKSSGGGGHSGGVPGTAGSGTSVPTSYTVFFNAGEGKIETGMTFRYTVASGKCPSSIPAVIAPEGKTFKGWAVQGTNAFVNPATYIVKGDTTFMAIYADFESHIQFIKGFEDNTVRGDAPITRAQVCAIIARLSIDYDEDTDYTSAFSDVPFDSWYANYIGYVYSKGYASGYSNGTFGPDENISRAEFAKIMQRVTASEIADYSVRFFDVAPEDWFVGYVSACADIGIFRGYEDGSFRPENILTRAEAVTVFNRAFGRVPDHAKVLDYCAKGGNPFTDLTYDLWYFDQIIEASFDHNISVLH